MRQILQYRKPLPLLIPNPYSQCNQMLQLMWPVMWPRSTCIVTTAHVLHPHQMVIKLSPQEHQRLYGSVSKRNCTHNRKSHIQGQGRNASNRWDWLIIKAHIFPTQLGTTHARDMKEKKTWQDKVPVNPCHPKKLTVQAQMCEQTWLSKCGGGHATQLPQNPAVYMFT